MKIFRVQLRGNATVIEPFIDQTNGHVGIGQDRIPCFRLPLRITAASLSTPRGQLALIPESSSEEAGRALLILESKTGDQIESNGGEFRHSNAAHADRNVRGHLMILREGQHIRSGRHHIEWRGGQLIDRKQATGAISEEEALNAQVI